VHGLSRAQIARRCGISVKMVEKHLATALAQLRRKVGDGTPGAF
jgi:RNA polymerase sigma-70 factor (ECF subfamily)